MKKRSLWLLVAALSMVLSANLFADFTVKQLSDKEVEVTFAFKGPDYKAVYIAGSFNSWAPSNDLMTKGADGTWTFVLKLASNDSVTWKYVADGNWIADLKAPAFVDDGFGGKNSVIDVAKYLAKQAAASSGAPVAEASGSELTPIGFGAWAILREDSKFLTKDIKTGETDGFDYDNTYIEGKSYYKLGGDLMPGLTISSETQVTQGSIQLYKANTNHGDADFTTWADGLQSLTDAIFHPFDAFNGNASPLLGHFKITLTTPYVKFFTGYKYSKGNDHTFIYKTSNATNNDAGSGFTEISLGDKLTNIADAVKLDVVVAPNKRSGTDGVYSWVNATILNDYQVNVAFNSETTNSNVFYYNKDNKNMVTLGGSAKFGPVTVQADSIACFGASGGVATAYGLQGLGAAVTATYKSDLIDLTATVKQSGDDLYTIYGDDGTLTKGYFYVELDPTLKLDPVTVALSSNVKFDNNFATIADSDMNVWAKPRIDVSLKDILPINMSVAALATMNLDYINASDSLRFKYNLAGMDINVKKLVDFIPNIDVYYDNYMSYGDWDATKKAYAPSQMNNIVLANLGLTNGMGVTAGAMFRTNLTDTENKKLCPWGVNLGYSWIVPIIEIKKPTLYVNAVYNFDPYDDGQPTFDMGDDDGDSNTFAPDYPDTNVGTAHIRAGLLWNF